MRRAYETEGSKEHVHMTSLVDCEWLRGLEALGFGEQWERGQPSVPE